MYETAFLKANYPLAYMAALASSVMGNSTKLGEYIAEIRRMGIPLLAPDINQSDFHFVVEEGAIRFGLGAIKYVGEIVIHAILTALRERGFKDMMDFYSRIDFRICNRKAIEALIQSGALDAG